MELPLLKLDMELQLSKGNELLEQLQKKAGEEVSEQYAKIFIDDAKVIKKDSMRWLVGIASAIILFVDFLVEEDKILPLSDSTVPTIIILSYVKRLLAISFFLFVITFIVKQYNLKCIYILSTNIEVTHYLHINSLYKVWELKTRKLVAY